MIEAASLAHLLNGLLMILLPVSLGVYLTRKFRLGWRLWWIGAGVFILSQVGHIPFNFGLTALFQQGILPKPPESWTPVFNAVVLGLSAGLWEEMARYAAYRWWARDARSWGKGLILGAGHGGIEAIILGGIVLATFANMVVARSLDLSSLVPPEQLAAAQQQVAAYWSAPWHLIMLGWIERCLAIIFHLAASLLVLQVFVRRQIGCRRQIGWLWLAVGWHALLDAVAVYAAHIWMPYLVEGLIGVLALVSLWIIFSLRQPEPVEQEQSPVSPIETTLQPLSDVKETVENLEKTRYE